MKKQLIWVFEWRKSVHYWWSYISFSPECKELTSMLDPLLYRWSVPPVVIRCVHWTMQREAMQTWITTQSPAIVMFYHVMMHWNRNIILMTFSSQTPLKLVILTTFKQPVNVVKLTFPFQCMWHLAFSNWFHSKKMLVFWYNSMRMY